MIRPPSDIEAQAGRILPEIAHALAGRATVTIEKCESQVGSGSLPVDRLPGFALAIRPSVIRRRALARVEALARAFRALPVPVVGRVHDGVFYLDLRCLEDENLFLNQLQRLQLDADRPIEEKALKSAGEN
jgi:L-seryl-tRNA(Ser) seleniumtransferase